MKENNKENSEDDDTFTFCPKKYIGKKKERNNLLNFENKNWKNQNSKKHIIRIPLYLSQNTEFLEKKVINPTSIKEKLNKIENELNNILLDNEEEDDLELIEFYDANKKQIPQVFNSKEKIFLQENFNLLCSLITELTKLIFYINIQDSNDKNEKFYYEKIIEKIKDTINLIEKINLKMNEFYYKIISFKNIFNRISYFQKNKNYLDKELKILKELLDREFKNYKENCNVFSKLKSIIPYLCNKAIININNQKKLFSIYYEILSTPELYT